MVEVLAPRRKPISDEFIRGFHGMTAEPDSLDDLIAAREALVDAVVGQMPEPHRRFLVSFERGDPDWQLLGLPVAPDLPAIRWRQQNLDKLTVAQCADLVRRLESVLFESLGIPNNGP